MSTENLPAEKKNNRKRAVAIGLVGLGVVGLGAASAATLNITTGGYDDVAAGAKDVTITAACDDAVTAQFAPATDYTTVANGISGESAVNVTLSDVAAECAGKGVQIAVYDGDDATAVGTYTGTLALTAGSTGALTLTGLTTNDAFDSVSIVIG
jgi:hypothetical protein